MNKEQKNPYKPLKAKINEIIAETPNVKTFKLELDEPINYNAGQFVMLTVPGLGECPFYLSSKPGKSEKIDVTVMRVGIVTGALHKMSAGNMVAVRGPYGNGFPLDELKNRELLIVAYGCGIAPVRTLIYEILNNPDSFPRTILIYGCKSPEYIIYKDSFGDWSNRFETYRTVDEAAADWEENEGDVTALFDKIQLDVKFTAAVIIGTPAMMKRATQKLEEIGVAADKIFISLERNMACGFGKCRHCLIGQYYVCKDGPVFKYILVKNLPDLWE